MKLTEIQDLIKFVAKSGVSEVELETKEVKIVIKTSRGKDQYVVQTPVATPVQQIITATPQQVIQPAQQQVQQTGENKTPQTPTGGSDESKYITIKSPMIGTFYRSPGPDKAVFVNVGDEVVTGKVVCIIEAMKLFNEIESDVKGRIVKVLVDDSTPVEYDQPLFLVDPS
ncbi:MAG TPA: acetyl-CoA carboxylase biotin carboxyl carrier protein [Bacteroidia bacterium]|jgi:acetyl-CoA carboxylase biotin carboxyl carrier protein|nr:acetyl-CoA carboxylase biotin carboxyl carrier protein [Bacteroidia bacterium]